MKYPKVLLISNVPFSYSNNMGKSLAGLFEEWEPACMAHLFFRDVPDAYLMAENNFRITDIQALRSVFLRKAAGGEIHSCAMMSRQDPVSGGEDRISRLPNKQSPLLTLIRDAVWDLSRWKSKKLFSWIESFSPEVILLPVGGGVFTYKIAHYIAKRYSLPVICLCYDDYFLHGANSKNMLARFQHKRLNKWSHKVMDGAAGILTMCEGMSEAYEPLFSAPCTELYTPANEACPVTSETANVAYFGNFSFLRWKQLAALGKAMKNLGYDCLRVYSASKIPEAERVLVPENGVCFHGSISASEVREKTAGCRLIVHTESFEPEMIEKVRYSISTKIADGLASGVCILAYGPAEVASIRYLADNQAAYVITREEDLEDGLREIMENAELRQEIIVNAKRLAEKNHAPKVSQEKVLRVLRAAVEANNPD